jgi:hypothetical protein
MIGLKYIPNNNTTKDHKKVYNIRVSKIPKK